MEPVKNNFLFLCFRYPIVYDNSLSVLTSLLIYIVNNNNRLELTYIKIRNYPIKFTTSRILKCPMLSIHRDTKLLGVQKAVAWRRLYSEWPGSSMSKIIHESMEEMFLLQHSVATITSYCYIIFRHINMVSTILILRHW